MNKGDIAYAVFVVFLATAAILAIWMSSSTSVGPAIGF